MARGLQLDWVLVRVNTVRTIALIAVLLIVAAAATVTGNKNASDQRRVRRDPHFDHLHSRRVAEIVQAQDLAQRRGTLPGIADRQVVEVEVDVVAVGADAAPLADFHGHRAADIVARRQVLRPHRSLQRSPVAAGSERRGRLTELLQGIGYPCRRCRPRQLLDHPVRGGGPGGGQGLLQ